MSFGNILSVQPDGQSKVWPRLQLGETAGRPESWLRDLLQANPELLPVEDIDASYGPLLPLCTELSTAAGPIDNVFIDSRGRLTIVECKLWRNPESRRKVIAQLLDYARILSSWSYSDLQRQVSSRLGQKGNIPFQIALQHDPNLQEQRFIDQVSRSLRQGRYLLLIAGDGIREDVQAISELINRNAASGFSFGLIEVALFGRQDGSILVQPRVIAKTQIIERTIFTTDNNQDAAQPIPVEEKISSNTNTNTREWWNPVLDQPFDDPDQSEPRYYHPNHIRAQLEWPGTWITAYRLTNPKPRIGVFVSGRVDPRMQLREALSPYRERILHALPSGSRFDDQGLPAISQPTSEFSNDDEQRNWIMQTLNAFVNVLRPEIAMALGCN